MAGAILVELDIPEAGLRRAFEAGLSSQQDFLLKTARNQGAPHLIIMALDQTAPSRTFTQVGALLKASPHAEVFLTAQIITPEILLESMRAGVKEFLPQPLVQEELKRALDRFKERRKDITPGVEKRAGRLFSAIGGKAGVGTTTFTVNLASCVHKLQESKSTVVADFNLYGGDLPLYLDVEAERGFLDIASDLDRLDNIFLMNILSRHSSGLYLLPFGYEEHPGMQLSADSVSQTLEVMQSMFDAVFVDCGARLDDMIAPVLERSSAIFVVTSLHVPVIRRTKALLDRLIRDGYSGEKLKLVMNRYDPNTSGFLKNAEEVLNRSVSWLVPHDYGMASHAINNGQPLCAIAPKSELALSYERIAESLDDHGKRAKDTSGLTGYLKSVKQKWSKDGALAR